MHSLSLYSSFPRVFVTTCHVQRSTLSLGESGKESPCWAGPCGSVPLGLGNVVRDRSWRARWGWIREGFLDEATLQLIA